MKFIGFLMVTVGFIIAALATVVDQSAIENANSVPVVDGSATEDANSVPADDQSATEDANSASLVDANDVEGVVSAGAHESTVKWLWYLPALALGVIGIVIIRTDLARHTRTEHHVVANIETIETSLAKIVTNIQKLNAEKDSINTYDMRHRIDELFVDDLEMFVDARESIGHRYGLTAYGDVMSSFAAGERYLNRVWSASADGYIDEVNAYIEKAQEQFVDSLDKIRALKINQTNPALSG